MAWQTNADEAALWVCSPEARLSRVLGLQLGGRLDLFELGHRLHHGGILAARGLCVAKGAVERGHGRRGVAIVGVGGNGGQLGLATNIVRAARVVGVGRRLLRGRAGVGL